MSLDNQKEFLQRQRRYFESADVTHFQWQTGATRFASRERDILAQLLEGSTGPLLEIGAGEGGNLFHLWPQFAQSSLCIGLDAFLPKLKFAAAHVPEALWTVADAGQQPFADATFATVLIRDVLHHLADPVGTVEEALRVLKPGGTIILMEPNARNPLIRLQMALVPAERGAARSTDIWLQEVLDRMPLTQIQLTSAVPFPLDRVVFHPQFGFPSLARYPWLETALEKLEVWIGKAIGPQRWSYWTARAVKLERTGN